MLNFNNIHSDFCLIMCKIIYFNDLTNRITFEYKQGGF